MSIMLGVLFPSNRDLDARFWREVADHLEAQGFGLSFTTEGTDFSKLSGWRNVAKGDCPDSSVRCYYLCDKPKSRQARLLAQWSEARPDNSPYVLPWGPKVRKLVDARQRYMSLQLLFVEDESFDFGNAFAEAAAQVLDGLVEDESASLLRTPDGDEFPLPHEGDEPSEEDEDGEEAEAGEEDASNIDLNTMANAQPPLAVPITFVLECRAPFTPQAVLGAIQTAAPEAELMGGGNPKNKRILASEKWVSFEAWDPDAGLSLCFERVGGRNPFYVRVACDLLEEYVGDPTEAGRREAAMLAVRLIQSVNSSLPLTVTDVER